MIIDAKENWFWNSNFFIWHWRFRPSTHFLHQLKYSSPFGIAEHWSLNKIWPFPYNVRGDAGRCWQIANNRRNSMTQTATTTVVVVVHLTLRHTFAADDNNKMMMMWCWWTIPTLKFTLMVFLDRCRYHLCHGISAIGCHLPASARIAMHIIRILPDIVRLVLTVV